MFRFAGFELDRERAELRGPDGEVVKLRPKALEMLQLFAANPGRVLSKEVLMEAVWPNVHVGEDSLFQCIREIRTALGDDRRQTIKLVSGRGYLFAAEVSVKPPAPGVPVQASAEPIAGAEPASEIATPGRLFGLRRPVAAAAAAGLCVIVGFAVAAPTFRPDLMFKRPPPTIALTPIVDASNDPRGAGVAAAVTDRLTDGLARIDNIRVVAPGAVAVAAAPTSTSSAQSDFVLNGELERGPQSWILRARMIQTNTGEVQAVATASVDATELDMQLQQSRLAAGAGHALARRLNALLESGAHPAATGDAKVAIEQATASINRTTRERFAAAQTMLEKALAAEPVNTELQIALAALQLRGIQMTWYAPAERAAAERNAGSLLERARQTTPRYIPVLEAYCRFLTATNEFVESLVACAKALSFDPWNGLVLYHIGLAQLQLGRFEDALATFKQADRFDTPEVSRWTWMLGAGWTALLMGRNEEAVSWLQRSIAITPASGRPYMLLAVAYQRLGQPDEARTAMAKAMALRPDSTALNIGLPTRNASPAFLAMGEQTMQTLLELGLPER
ncbi:MULTISPECIES: tetratricopeptide repeat protein [Bradyrhizobium]|uniref:tetratricopeptide repeat protein n=1 Tax=Bradyrhizobium elkanii TaxID=29448 RepID=UPI00041DB83A|nr:tetratricopeptide repeat protein [Bradyrhizobium elkanii]